MTTGAVLGAGLYGVRQAILPLVLPSQAPKPSPPTVLAIATTTTATTTTAAGPSQQRFFCAAGAATLWTLSLVGLGTAARMWSREEIEWQDRSWRLLEHRGQLKTNDWTYGGMAAGAAAAAGVVRPGPPWVGVLGAVSIGSLVGVTARMGYRFGVKEGTFEQEEGKGVALKVPS